MFLRIAIFCVIRYTDVNQNGIVETGEFFMGRTEDPELLEDVYSCILENIIGETITPLIIFDRDFLGEHTCDSCPWWQDYLDGMEQTRNEHSADLVSDVPG